MTTPHPSAPGGPVLDAATLDRLLRLGAELATKDAAAGNVLEELLGLFRNDAMRYLGALGEAAARGDEARAKVLVHTLKGAALGVGAARLAALCRSIEQLGESAAPVHHRHLEAEVISALAALEAALVRREAGGARKGSQA